MSESLELLRKLTDEALIAGLTECVAGERRATARLIATLSEFDVRRLFLGQGFGSLFDYCTKYLHLSENAASTRIAAARLARRFPIVLELIGDSRVSLTAVSLLAKHLNESNYRAILEEATYKTKTEVEVIVARLNPQPDARTFVRKLPEPSPSVITEHLAALIAPDPVVAEAFPRDAPTPSTRPLVKPLAPERYKVQFTVSGETRAKLRLVQDLLRHSIPNGDIAAVFERALSALLADLERRKLAFVARPRAAGKPVRTDTRHIPAAVRRDVWRRDKGRCAFVGVDGRCRERGGLELHHVKPFAAGGQATVENIQLRCRAHNAHEAEVFFAASRAP